jgi:aromatic ring hydroxylase
MNNELLVNRISDRLTVIVVHGKVIISLRTKPLLVIPMSQVGELHDMLKQEQLERRKREKEK